MSHDNTTSGLTRDNTVSSKNSLDVRDIPTPPPDDNDSTQNEDSGFTSIKVGFKETILRIISKDSFVQGNLGRQSTSNSLQIPGEETEVDNDTLPDSSEGESSSRNMSRTHSLSSSGVSSSKGVTPTKELF